MPKNVVRQSLNKPLHKVGLWRMSSWAMHHKRLTAAGLVVFMVAAIPIASLALSDTGGIAQQAQQKTSPDQTKDAQEPGGQKESSTITEEGEQPMQSDIKIESNSSLQGSDSSDVDVRVNGQNIPVPHNGSVHKQMQSDDGNATIDIQVDNNSSTHNSSSSSTVIVEQHSYTTGDETEDTGGSSRHPDRR